MTRARQTRHTFERINTPVAVPRVIADGTEATDDAVWSWAEIPAGSTYLLEEEELGRATWETATALGTVLPAGQEYHLKILWTAHHAEGYLSGWDSVRSVMAPGAGEYIALGARRIARNAEEGYFR